MEQEWEQNWEEIKEDGRGWKRIERRLKKMEEDRKEIKEDGRGSKGD